MQLKMGILAIRRYLDDTKMSDDEKLMRIGYSLPSEHEYQFHSHKDLLIEQAKKSGKSKFRLLASMNDSISLFNWCESQYNFIGMCSAPMYESENKDYTVEYSLEELESVIDNAESWLEGINERGDEYFVSNLQIMSM